MLELWKMMSSPLLLSLRGTIWPGVGVTDWVLSISQTELNCILMLNLIA